MTQPTQHNAKKTVNLRIRAYNRSMKAISGIKKAIFILIRLPLDIVLAPYRIGEAIRMLSELERAFDQPRSSKLVKLVTDDLNIMFKYVSRGIELHPFVKRESDALVIDFRETNKDAQIRYQLASNLITPSDSVLDCSCGYGGGTHFLSITSPAAIITGADNFTPAIRYAQRVFASTSPRLQFKLASASDPKSFPQSTFDLIVSLETIEHIPDDIAALRNFRHWLKPEGKVAISVPNEEVMPFDPSLHIYHHRHYTPESLRHAGEQAGLKLKELCYFGLNGTMDSPGPQIFAVFAVC